MSELRFIERVRAVLGDPMLDEAAMLDQINAILDEAPLPDSETEWGRRWPDGPVRGISNSRAQAEGTIFPTTQLVRREVGPWIEVPRG